MPGSRLFVFPGKSRFRRKSGWRVIFVVVLILTVTPEIHAQSIRSSGISSVDTTFFLDEVTVEAYRYTGRIRTIPGSVSLLGGEEIRLGDVLYPASLLNTIPGVSMQSGTLATGRITIRGMGSRTPYNTNRIRAYLNGIPLTGSDGISSVEDLDFQSLGRMEVVKGPSSALYGSGLGGSISLFTPAFRKDTARISLQYASFDTRNIHLSGNLHKGKSIFWSSVSHLRQEGYRENATFRRTSLLSAGQWENGGWSVNGTLLVTAMKGGIPSSLGKTLFDENPRAAAANWKATGGFQEFLKVLAGVTISARVSEKTVNRLTIYGKWNDDYERRPFNNLDDRAVSGGVINRVSIHTATTDWVTGVEWMTDQYGWELEKEGLLLNKNRENRSHFQLFAVAYFRPLPRLNLSLAGAVSHTRYTLTDLFPANGDQSGKRAFPLIFSPRAGVSYVPFNNAVFYASVGHGYSLPSPEETLLPEGDVNPGIRPEQGFQAETGLRLDLFSGRLTLDGSFYWIALKDLLVTKRVTEDIFTGINAGKTRHRGVELLVKNLLFQKSRFPGGLSAQLTYALSLNNFVDFTDDGKTYDGNSLPGIPAQTLHYLLSWNPRPVTSITAHIGYTGSQFLNDGNTLEQPGYFLGDLKMTVRLRAFKNGSANIFAGINNVTNTRYASMVVVNAISPGGAEPRYYYPGLPRNGFAGMELLF